MIHDLDATLKTLLEQELPNFWGSQVTISFETPDDAFAGGATSPHVDLFLYDVRENRELRSNEPLVQRSGDGTGRRARPPVRVACSYLVTAWPKINNGGSQSSNVNQEHMLLSEVLRVLLRHPTLPDAVLQGALAGQEPPLPTAVLQPGQLQSLGEFWQALGGKPKAALNYTVTIGVDVGLPDELAPVVIDQRTGLSVVSAAGEEKPA